MPCLPRDGGRGERGGVRGGKDGGVGLGKREGEGKEERGWERELGLESLGERGGG